MSERRRHWCRRVEHVDSEQVVVWFRQIGATDLRFVGDKGEQGPPDWEIRYKGNTIAVEVTLLRDETEGWPRATEMGIEDRLCELVEKVFTRGVPGLTLATLMWLSQPTPR